MTSAPPVTCNLRLTAPYRPLWWPRRILGESGLFGEWLATNNLSVAIKLSAAGGLASGLRCHNLIQRIEWSAPPPCGPLPTVTTSTPPAWLAMPTPRGCSEATTAACTGRGGQWLRSSKLEEGRGFSLMLGIFTD